MREVISTSLAPQAIGPYSQAIRVGSLLFVSGQVAIDPATSELVEGDVVAQAHRVLKNVGEILKAAGTSYGAVAHSTLYLADLNDFSAVNAVYDSYFDSPQPARATVEVSALPKNALLELGVIAVIEP